jgi:cytochrome c biogenesis protein CcmG/thiol:disulfide interchange protein DsbE
MAVDTAPPTEQEGQDDLGPARGGHTARWVSLAVGAVLLAFVGFLFTRDTGERSTRSELLGRLVPPVAGQTLDGAAYDIDDHRGEWVVVNFFASWCGPCRQEHPELVEFAERHATIGDASVVSVAFSDSEEDARGFFEELGGDWPVLTQDTGGIGIDFGVTGVPETYLVAPDGTVVANWVSEIDAATLDDTIARFTDGAA